MSEFVEQTIAERLIFEIESGRWSPETQDGPPHLWLHPWFALCSPRTVERISKKVLERFHEVILHRGWTPTDRSIVETLKPWKWSLLGHDDSLAYEQILAQVKHSIDLYLSECSVSPLLCIAWRKETFDCVAVRMSDCVQTLLNCVGSNHA